MSTIEERLREIKETLPESTRVIAVSKFHPTERILEAYNAGQRLFGENRAQEMTEKQPQLPSDIEWHFIGTLQRNKVKYIVPFVHTIHSVDSIRLLDEIERQCARLQRESVRVLLQIHISGEETKHGFDKEELDDLINSGALEQLQHVKVVGLMGMASLTDDLDLVDSEFARMRGIFDALKGGPFAGHPEFKELSIGMSGDYQLAVRHGATYVRIGTAIFGAREY
ncbi:MAG: YggS family pyridoxal phosphate-dependent enzyme [Porphyromonas sp.]|nr:YggS family pyridoxal phosphate-dependent enzyme [Porphyromonas sp.]